MAEVEEFPLVLSPPPVCRARWIPGGRAAVHSGQRQGGFTFVELLVVVILVGLTALISIVSITTFLARYQLDSEAQKLSAFLNSVPSLARRTNAPVYLVWQSAASRFVISRDAAGTQTLDEFQIDRRITFTPPAATTLRCDIVGRVFVGTGTTMISTMQTFTLQHPKLVGKGIPTFRLRVPPLWAVLVDRV